MAQDTSSENSVLVPLIPPKGLLISMAMRLNHAFCMPETVFGEAKFGLSDGERQAILSDMERLYEEMTGRGFYHPEREQAYLDMLKIPKK